MYGFNPTLSTKLVLPKTSPRSRIISNVGKKQNNIWKQDKVISKSSIDMSQGIEQFSGKDRENIEYALVSGDYSNLSNEQKAWINQQAIAKEKEIQQELTEEQALALAQAQAVIEQETLAQAEQQAIKQQKMKQYTIYGAVGIVGIGLIYLAMRK